MARISIGRWFDIFRSFICSVCGQKVRPWERNVRGDNAVRIVDYDCHSICSK